MHHVWGRRFLWRKKCFSARLLYCVLSLIWALLCLCCHSRISERCFRCVALPTWLAGGTVWTDKIGPLFPASDFVSPSTFSPLQGCAHFNPLLLVNEEVHTGLPLSLRSLARVGASVAVLSASHLGSSLASRPRPLWVVSVGA